MKTARRKVCKVCHHTFTTYYGFQKYCSGACRRAYRQSSSVKYEKFCRVCHDFFVTGYPWTKYCSKACRIKVDVEHAPFGGGIPIREFYCKDCNARVLIGDTQDRRTVFCSRSCERKYWKKPADYKHHATSNRGLSGGMSLGSLIRREKRDLWE